MEFRRVLFRSRRAGRARHRDRAGPAMIAPGPTWLEALQIAGLVILGSGIAGVVGGVGSGRARGPGAGAPQVRTPAGHTGSASSRADAGVSSWSTAGSAPPRSSRHSRSEAHT